MLPDLLDAVATYVAQAIEPANGEPVGRVLRYWGVRGVPEDEPCEAGVLSVFPTLLYSATNFPVADSSRRGLTQLGPPAVELRVRYHTCWPTAQIVDGQVQLDDPTWDAVAARLQGIMDAGARALLNISNCDPPAAAEVTARTGTSRFRYLDCRPTGPSGGAAGMEWRCIARVLSGVAP